MTIATVTRKRVASNLDLGLVGEARMQGSETKRWRALWMEDRGDGKRQLLLGSPQKPIAPGSRGIEEAIRFIVGRFGRSDSGCELEFSLDGLRDKQERQRLLSMAGGLIAAAKMSAEERRERAMKAAVARYRRMSACEEKAVDGTVVRCEIRHLGNRQWELLLRMGEEEVLRQTAHTSRAAEQHAQSFVKTWVTFLNFKKEQEDAAQ